MEGKTDGLNLLNDIAIFPRWKERQDSCFFFTHTGNRQIPFGKYQIGKEGSALLKAVTTVHLPTCLLPTLHSPRKQHLWNIMETSSSYSFWQILISELHAMTAILNFFSTFGVFLQIFLLTINYSFMYLTK